MSYLNSRALTVNTADTLISPTRSREKFGIQNHDATNPIYVVFNGAEGGTNYGRPATALIGIKVLAGEFYDLTAKRNELSGEIRGISTGGNVACVVVEG